MFKWARSPARLFRTPSIRPPVRLVTVPWLQFIRSIRTFTDPRRRLLCSLSMCFEVVSSVPEGT